jgi:predicted transcriptional regulator
MSSVKYRKLGALNELYAPSLMMYIEENGEVNAQDLRNVCGSYYASKKMAEVLRDDDLIEIDITEEPRIRITYRLTEKGKLVADKLKEIDKIMDG